MRRKLVHLLLVVLLGTIPVVLGLALALTVTRPGRALLTRYVSHYLDGVVRGDVEVGAISGSFLFGLHIDHLVVRDTAGEVFIDLPQVDVSYRVPNLLANRIILTDVRLDRPTIQFIKHRGGRMNYEEILRSGESPGGGAPPLIEFRGVRIDHGAIHVFTPWNPSAAATTDALRATELTAQRARPGRRITESREGLRKAINAEDLTAYLPIIRVSTPKRDPLALEFDTLATRLNDPGVTFTDFTGRLEAAHDSVRLDIKRAAFPATVLKGSGVISFPRDTVLLDLTLDLPQLDLRDVRWVSPKFPAMTGSTRLRARSFSEARTEYDLRDLRLQGGPGRLEGDLVAITDVHRGLGVRAMRIRTNELDLETVRPYLDSLPFAGTITGPIEADGFFDDMAVTLDVSYTEARLPARPRSHLKGGGHLELGGPNGLVFHEFSLDDSDLDLPTVRLMAPAVVLEGRAALRGTLNGPLRDMTFGGTINQQDGTRPPSAMEGTLRLDTRSPVLGLDADVALRPLDFEGIRRGFPSLRSRGQLSGRVRTHGTLEHLDVDFDLAGALGRVQGKGGVTLLPPRYGADRLALDFSDLNLAAVAGAGPATLLNGHAVVSGRNDPPGAPELTVNFKLRDSWVREVGLDSLLAELRIEDSVIRLDTLEADWGGVRAGGRLSGRGTLGWAQPRSGSMTLFAAAGSLAPFDSLLGRLTGMSRDTAADAVPLEGSSAMQLTLGGSLDSLQVHGDVRLEGFAWQRYRAPFAGGTFQWTGGARPITDLTVQADSLKLGDLAYRAVDVHASGWSDSLSWAGSLESIPEGAFSGGGRWWRRGGQGWILSVDSLTAALPAHRWRLDAPADVELGHEVMRFQPVRLVAEDGSGSLRLRGDLPKAGLGGFSVEARGIALQDVYALAQRDTAGIAGELSLDLEIGGTGADPTLSGTGSLGDLVLGDFHAPFVQGVFDYRSRRLDANLILWRTGARVLQVEAQLPLDLALKSVARREIPGNLLIKAKADSVDLALLEAFTPNLRRVAGRLKTDLEIRGGWEAPRLSGALEVTEGAATIPSLGVRYGHINGGLRFSEDSILVDHLRATSGPGDLVLTGAVRLERLTRPVLGLKLTARDFLAIDDKTFLTLEVSGNGNITGPVYGAVLRGDIVARRGVLHFADLVNKRIVDLTDPTAQDLVDTTLIRTQKLGAAFQSVFLDSLTVRDLRLTVQDQFWLRSSDANIQMEGAIVANKTGPQYRFDGTLNALRGTYTLRIGFVTRDFQVERGTVRYFGTPDFNAELDIQATHVVQAQGEEIPVIAKITGTLLVPKLALESSIRPAPTESELVSYLMFGRPSPELAGLGSAENNQRSAAFEAGLSYLTSALSSEVQRALVSDVGIPIDFIEIRTGGGNPFGATAGRTQVAVGWQLTNRAFATLDLGVCRTDVSTLSAKSIGAGIEYRMSRVWRFQTSVEPILDCRPAGSPLPLGSNRYQLGLDLLWEKEY